MADVAFLSFVAALGGILFGYDTAVISGTMVSLYQFAITLGFVLAYFVNYLILVNLHVADLWRVMPGAEAVFTLLFFAAMCLPYLFIIWRLVPDTTGRSLEEIESHWRVGGGRMQPCG